MNEVYNFTVPVFEKHLNALKGVLTKSEAFAKEKGLDEKAVLQTALAPDMFPLVKQVQVACDNAKGLVARLSKSENPKHEDTEQTFSELQARIDKTLAFVSTATPDSFKDLDSIQVVLAYFPGKYMTAFDYAREYALPNFFFHTVTAYDIVRHLGVQIGKEDFMDGKMPFKDLPAA